MRLTGEQIRTIYQVVSCIAGDTVDTYIFGSRLKDEARGGDVDILVESDEQLGRIEQAKIKMELEQRLGLPVDLLIRSRKTKPTPFHLIARAHAVRLVPDAVNVQEV